MQSSVQTTGADTQYTSTAVRRRVRAAFYSELIDLACNNKQSTPAKSSTSTLPLDQVAEGYRAMDECCAIKALLRRKASRRRLRASLLAHHRERMTQAKFFTCDSRIARRGARILARLMVLYHTAHGAERTQPRLAESLCEA